MGEAEKAASTAHLREAGARTCGCAFQFGRFWLRAEAQLCLPAAALSGGGSRAAASGPFPEKDSAEFCFSFKGLWFLVSALSSRAPLST